MVGVVAEHVQEKVLPSMNEKKLFLVKERDIIAELAETDEIKALRKEYRESNEISYGEDRDILSFALTLSGVATQNVYVGKIAAIYFEILDTRDFLLEKYTELSPAEATRYKSKLEPYLEEAEEELESLKSLLHKYE